MLFDTYKLQKILSSFFNYFRMQGEIKELQWLHLRLQLHVCSFPSIIVTSFSVLPYFICFVSSGSGYKIVVLWLMKRKIARKMIGMCHRNSKKLLITGISGIRILHSLNSYVVGYTLIVISALNWIGIWDQEYDHVYKGSSI